MIESFCECGCGGKTNLATQTKRRLGHVKGQPVRFINGHHRRGHKASPETRARRSAAGLGPKNPFWKGGRWKASNGYINVWLPSDHPFAEMCCSNGYVLEHRLRMAQRLGRALSSKEVVHHRNGVVDDNRLENLELFESGVDHSRHHQKLRKAAAF